MISSWAYSREFIFLRWKQLMKWSVAWNEISCSCYWRSNAEPHVLFRVLHVCVAVQFNYPLQELAIKFSQNENKYFEKGSASKQHFKAVILFFKFVLENFMPHVCNPLNISCYNLKTQVYWNCLLKCRMSNIIWHVATHYSPLFHHSPFYNDWFKFIYLEYMFHTIHTNCTYFSYFFSDASSSFCLVM